MFHLSGLARLLKSLVKSRPLLCSQINWRRFSALSNAFCPDHIFILRLTLPLLGLRPHPLPPFTPPLPTSLSFTTVPSPQRLPWLIHEDWDIEVFLSQHYEDWPKNWVRCRSEVPKLWYADHGWYTRTFQVVRNLVNTISLWPLRNCSKRGHLVVEKGNNRNYLNPKTLYYKRNSKTLLNLVLDARVNFKKIFFNHSEVLRYRVFIQVKGWGGSCTLWKILHICI